MKRRTEKKTKTKKQSSYPVLFARFVSLFIGAILGYWLSQLTLSLLSEIIKDWTSQFTLIVNICSSVFLGILFFIATPVFLNFVVNIGFAIEKKLTKYSSKDIAGGMVGLLLGLIAAMLTNNLLELIPFDPLATILTILNYILLGTIGLVLGMRKLKEIVIVDQKSDTQLLPIKLIDTSVLIDGRILPLVKTGFLEGRLIIPKFVIEELHALADSSDALKRKKARQGLDIIKQLQEITTLNLTISDDEVPEKDNVDEKLIKLASALKAKILTLDYNLNKVANVLSVEVLNINELVSSLKANILVGDTLEIEIVKIGKDKNQGVGYLADGTMVVIENGGNSIGKIETVIVTSNIQTNAGKMIFTRIGKFNE